MSDTTEENVVYKVTKVLKTTQKATLVEMEDGKSFWIPISCIISYRHKPGKKRPWRFTLVHWFVPTYIENNSEFA